MNVETNSKCIIGIFFLYLVMVGSSITSLLNCSLQRFLLSNIFIKHLIVFLSIIMFTFILNWYTPSSLTTVEAFDLNEYNNRYKYIIESVYYSILIYVIFLFSTKQTPLFMNIFLFLICFIIILFICYKIELTHLNINYIINKNVIDVDFVKELFIKNNKNNKNVPPNNILYNTVFYHNSLFATFIFLCLTVISGVYFYYKKQIVDHKKKWNWIKFIFGTNNCRNIKYY